MTPKKVMNALYEAHTKRSWTEDSQHENGNYTCLCADCGLTFTGHKRRIFCKDCTTQSNVEKPE